ncbi:hypothetical protein ACSRUE_36535 [Sorangium sp. KYC3313]
MRTITEAAGPASPELGRILKMVDETVARGARALLRGAPQGLVLPPSSI